MTAISRNQMCPCNSGKRYKHCCGAEDQAAAPVTIQGVKTQALARQRAVDLISAEKLYRQALEMQPDEPDCLHMLGGFSADAPPPRGERDDPACRGSDALAGSGGAP